MNTDLARDFQVVVATSLRDVGALPIVVVRACSISRALRRGKQRRSLQSLLLLDKRQVRFATLYPSSGRRERNGRRRNKPRNAGLWAIAGRERHGQGGHYFASRALRVRCISFVLSGHLDEEIFRNGFRERGQADLAVELVD